MQGSGDHPRMASPFVIGKKAPGGKDAPEWTSLAEITPDADFRKAGEELLAFRLKYGDEMEENWGALFRTYPVEVRLWMRMRIKKTFPEIADP